jgi:hypothetical protein
VRSKKIETKHNLLGGSKGPNLVDKLREPSVGREDPLPGVLALIGSHVLVQEVPSIVL